ncbi:hypothetical protein LCGC14_2087590 [marine sediment metagenome]|uniref:CpXC domain-containing protein n=1 Tax=marine sediment metagenome TaxID=412755 RepID=A0A0F9HAQ0_9ZZZZ
MKEEKEYKCGKCGEEYTFEQMTSLPHIQSVQEDTNPKEQHGFTSVCIKCGYVFHRDKFKVRESIEIDVEGNKGVIDVSTVFLELNHDGYWYETMLFEGEGSKIDLDLCYSERFETKKEAVKNHEKIVKMLKEKKFDIIIKPLQYEIELKEHKKEVKK